MSDTVSLKDVALSVGWYAKAYHIVTEYNDKWLLRAPNHHVYQNGRAAEHEGPYSLTPPSVRVYETHWRDTEDQAWNDLPASVEEITDGWKFTSGMSDFFSA